MKVFAASAVLALAASTQSACATSCLLDLTALTTALADIVTDAYDCQTKTKFDIVPPSRLPTPAEVTSICTQCTKLIAGAKNVKFPDCTFPIDGKEMSIATLFDQIVGQCPKAETGAANSTTPAATTAAPAATTAAPAATTAAPAATTAAPAATTAAPAATTAAPAATTVAPKNETGSAASDKSSATVETPAPTTKAPAATTAAPKSAAAGVSATLGAAVAVACSVAALVL